MLAGLRTLCDGSLRHGMEVAVLDRLIGIRVAKTPRRSARALMAVFVN